uniref:Transmembrane protein n=1 Tax=Triparma pacifica TaxID=91992 RepID=A0A7S2VW40_9STRA|mmetsp:Transcript_1738/g.3377  ORF Transcript_1738/g.3377 Transcript_1738/m.3377 type:complete len:629 (+) Transcript_1738:24-1910(+)
MSGPSDEIPNDNNKFDFYTPEVQVRNSIVSKEDEISHPQPSTNKRENNELKSPANVSPEKSIDFERISEIEDAGSAAKTAHHENITITEIDDDLQVPLLPQETRNRGRSTSSTASSNASSLPRKISCDNSMFHNAPQKVTWSDIGWDLVFVAICHTFTESIVCQDSLEWSFKRLPNKWSSLTQFIPTWRLWVHSVTIMNNMSLSRGEGSISDIFFTDYWFCFASMVLLCCWSANLERCFLWQPPRHYNISGHKTNFKDAPLNANVPIYDDSHYWVCSDSSFFYIQLRGLFVLIYASFALGYFRIRDREFRIDCVWNALVNFIVMVAYFVMRILGADPKYERYLGGDPPSKLNIIEIGYIYMFTLVLDMMSGLLPFFITVFRDRYDRFELAGSKEVLVERFGLLLVICLGEIVKGAASPLENSDSKSEWKTRVDFPDGPWDAWSPFLSNPYVPRLLTVALAYFLKLLVFDAAIVEEQFGATHPLAQGRMKAEMYKLATFPIALALIILGSITKHFIEENILIFEGVEAENCLAFNVSLGCVLIFSGFQLMIYKERTQRLRTLKNKKVAARVFAGLILFAFRTCYMLLCKIFPSDDDRGDGWQFCVILLILFGVVVNDIRCRNRALAMTH